MTCMSRLMLNNSWQFNSYPAFVFFALSLLTIEYILDFFISLFQTFSGNKDRNTLVEHLLMTAFNTRFVRFHPKTYSRHTCLRAEVYGCRNGTLISLVRFKHRRPKLTLRNHCYSFQRSNSGYAIKPKKQKNDKQTPNRSGIDCR